MPHTPPLLKEAQNHLPAKELEMLRDAYEMAEDLYGQKTYRTGEKLMQHVETVARLLMPLHPDVQTLIATLLQYAASPDEFLKIKDRFGGPMGSMISSLSVLDKSCCKLACLPQSQLHKMILALSGDVRVLLICLHSRWHTLERAQGLPKAQREILAREILDVFAPIAARLGIYSLKYTLETLSFFALYAKEAEVIEKDLQKIRKEQGSLLEKSKNQLESLLRKEGGRVHIVGREKHPYSIHRKMNRKSLTAISDIYDLLGLRILVESVEDCYQVLGIIHRTYRPILHRIKDYIAMPKPNGYRSLHTTVTGLSAKDPSMPVEVQIRTYQMEEEAEYGIAAHWNYKEKVTEKPQFTRAWQERMKALQKLTLSATTEGEMADTLREEIADHIYVLTPKGDPLELPKGATPLDFAFRVHTDIGLRFHTAKVNGVIAPIDKALENGDMVEITKRKEPQPSEQWVQIVHTKDARQKLRNYFRKNEVEHGKPFEGIYDLPEQEEKKVKVQPVHIPQPDKQSIPRVQLDAETKLPFRFAKCCQPQKHAVQRPAIIGCTSRMGRVIVHWAGCQMLEGADPKRLVRAWWIAPKKENAEVPAELTKTSKMRSPL